MYKFFLKSCVRCYKVFVTSQSSGARKYQYIAITKLLVTRLRLWGQKQTESNALLFWNLNSFVCCCQKRFIKGLTFELLSNNMFIKSLVKVLSTFTLFCWNSLFILRISFSNCLQFNLYFCKVVKTRLGAVLVIGAFNFAASLNLCFLVFSCLVFWTSK